jgi:putative spermidine/putrescine transport system ATP-binding protein
MSGAGRRVEVSGLWKRYGAGAYVVRDVNFDLQPGEFLTLLGPSGSGKSTTLLMVAGFETPSGGTIRVDGTDIAGRLPEHRNFGVVFQGYALFPHMTVQENVEFPLRMKRVPGADRRRRAAAMLEKVGLAEFAARRPRELSGGQQQRVALARALVFEPDALLLDEPLGALDRKLREQLQVEIKEIQRRVGISILFVTHDQDEAMMMSDRIAVMQEGRIVQMGSPPDVYLHPGTQFVAGFLGETNMLPGVMCGRDGPHGMVKFSGGTLGHARLPREGTPPGAGDSVVVALRPERIRLLAPSDPSEVAFDGVVCSHTFLGRSARYVVQLPGQAIVVSTPQWPPPAHVRDGAEVRLGWSREDAQILGTEDVDAGT